MLKGVNLQLYVGPLVPVLADRAVIEALTEVTVTTKARGSSGFQLSFLISTRSSLHTLFLLTGGSQLPIRRVVVVVIFNGMPNVIMDGMVTKQEVEPGSQEGYAKLVLTGQDLSAVMGLIDFSGFPYPVLPAEGRVGLMLLKYAALGIVPLVVPSILIDIELPTSKIHAQQGTDLDYIKALARNVGYVFNIEHGSEPGLNVAYWGPELRVGVPQPALNTNMDVQTNVESLTFSFDHDKNAIPTIFYQEELTGVPVPIPLPPITPLSPPLGLIPPIPNRLKSVSKDLDGRTLPQAIMIGLAKAAQWAEAVKAQGELNVVRYGGILKARRLVGVRGAGPAFDGLYYVKSVTHKIKRGEYKQSFELARNGLLSTIPRVPT